MEAFNELDNEVLDKGSFSFEDIRGRDSWTAWTPVFTGLTVVGTPNYVGRYKIVGKMCFVQVTFSASTSVQNTPVGTAYVTLPITAKGIAGMFTCSDTTLKAGTGVCWMDEANSRVYIPAITPASADLFDFAGFYEV